MIFVVDSVSHGIQHTPVNAAMLEILRLAYPDRPIRFHAEEEHLAGVRSLMSREGRDSIECRGAKIPAHDASFAKSFYMELNLFRRLLRNASECEGYVLALSSAQSTLFALKLLHLGGYKEVPVQAILHGNLSEIVSWRSRNPLRRAFDLYSALSAGRDERLRYVVLEPSIARRLLEILPRLTGAVDWLHHPSPPAEGANHREVPPLPLNVAFLGLATAAKGFDIFVRTAAAVKQSCNGSVAFHAVGRFPPNLPALDMSALDSKPQAAGLPRSRYVSALNRAHYICLPYQGHHYELSASGVLLDAIAWSKPIIALPSPAIRDLFAANPGIGYLCSTEEEMKNIVQHLAHSFDQDEYARQAFAMSTLRRSRLPAALAIDYRRITDAFVGGTSHDSSGLVH